MYLVLKPVVTLQMQLPLSTLSFHLQPVGPIFTTCTRKQVKDKPEGVLVFTANRVTCYC